MHCLPQELKSLFMEGPKYLLATSRFVVRIKGFARSVTKRLIPYGKGLEYVAQAPFHSVNRKLK